MGWQDITLAEETKIPKGSHQNHLDNIFDSQSVVHKEFLPMRKKQ
jgi:hypothetical protein